MKLNAPPPGVGGGGVGLPPEPIRRLEQQKETDAGVRSGVRARLRANAAACVEVLMGCVECD